MKANQRFPRDDSSPGFIRGCFNTLRQTPPAEVRTAIEWIETGEANLALEDCAKALAKYSDDRGVPISNPGPVLKALFAIEAWRAELDLEPAVVLRWLQEEDARMSGQEDAGNNADLKGLSDLVLRFLGDSNHLRVLAKAQRLYEGVLPSFDSCCSAVELRPVFDVKRASFKHGVIVATLTVQVREIGEYEGLEEYSLYLDGADIDDLIKELGKLKAEFASLRNFASAQVKLLNPTQSFSHDLQ